MLTFWKNNAELTKIKAVLALCGIFSENMCLHLRTIFQVFSIILTICRHGGILPIPDTMKRTHVS